MEAVRKEVEKMRGNGIRKWECGMRKRESGMGEKDEGRGRLYGKKLRR
jgi:hypothetical protein